MSKRKLIKNIANGIINSFVSRNNNVYGYWGIGKLYNLMILSKSMKIEIDLIEKTIVPKDEEFRLLINQYSEYLFSQMKKQGIRKDYIKSAIIELNGYSNNPILALGNLAPHKMNCKIKTIDNLENTCILEKNIWCRGHNPNLESKRAGNYEN